MQTMVFGCEKMFADEALKKGLLSKIVPQKDLLSEAFILAEKFGSYLSTPVRETKHTINKTFIEELDLVCNLAKSAHRKTFATGKAQQKMRDIIKQS